MDIAIIGAQVRFPGGHASPDSFFKGICRGENYCTEIPAKRWRAEKFFNSEDAIGKAYVSRGHFLDYDYEQFDARAFGMSPREAEFLDPQQRLLLETTWEAIESAGLDMQALDGSRTGVYVGGFTVDHLLNQLSNGSRDAIGSYSAAGATLTMLANRISYAFNLNGPSISLDTACSSSLVAFVMAAQDIDAGRCDAAIVGGVNFMMRPEYMIAMSKGNFLARDGRSKSFDARADGYGRGEGCGVLVLMEAARARAEGHALIAIVEGAGINQDGRTNGITVPNPEAQEALMREVAARYGIDPASVDYVEAHGTGTPVGDPKEATAIGRVYGVARREAGRGPVVIGSVKSNIGHLEAAAGVAGVIKAAWSLQSNQVPPIALLEKPNPALPLEALNIALATGSRTLAEPGTIGRAAVNAFGYGGTNAHVVLRAVTAPGQVGAGAPPAPIPTGWYAIPVSARSETALRRQAGSFAERLAAGANAEDLIYTASRLRSHHEERALVYAADPQALRQALGDFARGEAHETVTTGRALHGRTGKTAFIYTGMGPQWWGMARGMLETNRVFRAAAVEADALFTEIAGFSILAEMRRDEASSEITRTDLAQPANFLVQYALTRALAAEGVLPDAVLGHSVGEVASAWASGMLTLEQAIGVSRHRSRIQAKAAGLGGMLAVGLGEETLADILADLDMDGDIDIAAVNSPSAITVAGDSQVLEQLHARLRAEGVFSRRLEVAVPYHSRFMEPLRPELIDALGHLSPTAPECRLYSTVTGQAVEDLRYDANYWCDNVRRPVRFMAALEALIADGYRHLIEVGPHPVLSRSIKETAAEMGAEIALTATLSMKTPDGTTFPRAIAQHYVSGGKVDWSVRSPWGRRVVLPSYPWDRERLWRETPYQIADRTHFEDLPFGQTLAADGALCADLNVAALNYLHQHRVDGSAVLPAAAFLEALLEAASPESTAPRALYDIGIEKSLMLSHEAPLILATRVDRDTGKATVEVRGALASGEASRHAQATARPLIGARPERVAIGALRGAIPLGLDIEPTYRRFAELGLDYGDAFRTITELRHSPARNRALARLRRHDTGARRPSHTLADPTLVDGAFQAALSLVVAEGAGAYLPVSIGELRLHRVLPASVYALIRVTSRDANRLTCDIDLFDEEGEECLSIAALECAALFPAAPPVRLPEGDYVMQWRQAERPHADHGGSFVVIGSEQDALTGRLAEAIAAEGRLTATLDWDRARSRRKITEAMLAGTNPLTLVLSFDAGLDEADPFAEQALERLLELVQGLEPLGEAAPRCALITRGGMPCAEEPGRVVPAQAALVNFARVVVSEMDFPHLVVIDLDGDQPDVAGAIAELKLAAPPTEVALRADVRRLPDLAPSGLFAAERLVQVEPAASPWGRPAIRLESGRLVKTATRTPSAGEVEIAFDALCLLPGDAPLMGFSGAIGRVGAGVDAELCGRAIFGLAPIGARTIATVPLESLSWAERPAWLAPESAAALGPIQSPVAALLERIGAGELCHCLVVDTPYGRTMGALLEDRGAKVIRLPATTRDWAESMLRDGDGCFDLIAAPLASLDAHFPLSRWLRPGGHLVEIGERQAKPLLLPKQAASLQCLGASQTPPLLSGAALESLATRAVECLEPQRLSDWPGDGAEPRLLRIDPGEALRCHTDDAPELREDATYLVTGGLGGLGQRTALWLADCGARRLVLLGRRGRATRGADALITQLRWRGAEAIVLACDVSSLPEVHAAVAMANRPEAPLRGVFHAAGALADRPIVELTPADLRTSLCAKVQGADCLQRVTMGLELDYFVLYSSVSPLVGNKRQASYCAANGYLDALAHQRRLKGLPALSVNFGAIGEVGMAADPNVEAHLRQIGLPPLAPEPALAGVAVALQTGISQVYVGAKADWSRYAHYDPRSARTDRLSRLCGPFLGEDLGDRLTLVRAELAKLGDEDRQGTMATLLGDMIAGTLGIEAKVITPTRPLADFGLDSLISVEVQVAIETSLGVKVSAMALLGDATVDRLARSLLSSMGLGPAEDPGAVATLGPVRVNAAAPRAPEGHALAKGAVA